MAARDFGGLLKIAGLRPLTVGDSMRLVNADIGMDPAARRGLLGSISASGLDVKAPASRLPYVVGGGIAGRAAASALGAGGLLRGLSAIGGAIAGGRMYDRLYPDASQRRYAPGFVQKLV